MHTLENKYLKVTIADNGAELCSVYDKENDEDTTYGPFFEPLAEAIVKESLAPRIICESDGTQAEDALWMKNCVRALQ